MGDSGACLMHAFSYASGLPHEANQGNPMHALRESISFGRFMSETLAWEKWSTFSHNRYVEEAERYAQPGSVAQKAAFFEAHYKRIAAAKKAAALLEQANAASNTTEQPQAETGRNDVKSPSDSQTVTSDSHEAVIAQTETEAKAEYSQPDFLVNADDNDHNANIELVEPVTGQVGGTYVVKEPEAPMETPVKKDLSNPAENVESEERILGSDLSGTPQMGKPLPKSSSSSQEVSSVTSKKISAFSSLKSSVYDKTSKVPCSPANPITPYTKKESNATPITKKSPSNLTDKKRSTPKSLRMYMNYTPAKEPDKSFGPSTRKADNSRIASKSDKASQDCATPLRTPNMAASARMSKHASATPRSEYTRTKSPTGGRKTTGPKWHILSAVCSKSLTACRNKLQSPTSSTPFILRTEEQKLEEKFNSKEVQKVQLQAKLKEKAKSDLRKLRQSFCFKACPLPDFSKDSDAVKSQMNKSSTTTLPSGT